MPFYLIVVYLIYKADLPELHPPGPPNLYIEALCIAQVASY
jgi:hypothetical protein